MSLHQLWIFCEGQLREMNGYTMMQGKTRLPQRRGLTNVNRHKENTDTWLHVGYNLYVRQRCGS